MSDFKLIIDGKPVDTTESFAVLNPATETVVAQCPKASIDDLNNAVGAAKKAFPSWSATPDSERARIVHAIGEALEANSAELCQLLVQEQGKPMGGFAGLGAGFEMGGTVALRKITLRCKFEPIR